MDDLMNELDAILNSDFLSQAQVPQSYSTDDQVNNVLNVKKRIILTDEVLGKFSGTLTENEKLKAENLRYLGELQDCRKALLSHLTKDNDLQKKCDQLETKLRTTQQELDFQINLVAARDSVAHQYVSLIKEKEEEIKKLKEENKTLKNNKDCDKTEEKKLRRKYIATSKRLNKLNEVFEKLQTCSNCRHLIPSSKTGKRNVTNDSYIDDMINLSPQSSIPASVCSIDTGFESNLSDSDCDAETVSKNRISRKAVLGKRDNIVLSENEDKHSVEQTRVNDKCKIPSRRTLKNDGLELLITVCQDNIPNEIVECSLDNEDLSPKQCTHCSNVKVKTAEKFVQTHIVKYVNSCTETYCDNVSKSVQTIEKKLVSDDSCKSVEIGVQTIPVEVTETSKLLNSAFTGNCHRGNDDRHDHENLYDRQVLQCTIGCQTPVRNWQSDTGCQTEETLYNKQVLQHNISCQTEVRNWQRDSGCQTEEEVLDSFSCDAFSPVPFLLSPFPPSPAIEVSERIEMDAENLSDTSSSSSDEDTVDESQLLSTCVRAGLFTSTASQTEDNCCSCSHSMQISHSDAAVQCDSSISESSCDRSISESSCDRSEYDNKISPNNSGIKQKEVSAAERSEPHDREEFWRTLVLWLISSNNANTTQNVNFMDLFQGGSNSNRNESFFNSLSQVHSDSGQMGRSHLQSKDFSLLDKTIQPNIEKMNCGRGSLMKKGNKKIRLSLKNTNIQGQDLQDNFVESARMKIRKRVCCTQKSEKRKMKNSKKNSVKCLKTKLSVCQRGHKSMKFQPLKRKLRSEISATTSGSFVVSSVPVCSVREVESRGSDLVLSKYDEYEHSIQCENMISNQTCSQNGLDETFDSLRRIPASRRVIELQQLEVNKTASPYNSNLPFCPNPASSQPRRTVMKQQWCHPSDIVIQTEPDARNGLLQTKQADYYKFHNVNNYRKPFNSQIVSFVSHENMQTFQPQSLQNSIIVVSSRNSDKLGTSHTSEKATTQMQNKERPYRLDCVDSCGAPELLQCTGEKLILSSKTIVPNCENILRSSEDSFDIHVPRKIRKCSQETDNCFLSESCSNKHAFSGANTDNNRVSIQQNSLLLRKPNMYTDNMNENESCFIQSNHKLSAQPSLKIQTLFTENINLLDSGQNFVENVSQTRRKTDSYGKNTISSNEIHTQNNMPLEVEKISSELFGNDSNSRDETENYKFTSKEKTLDSEILEKELSLDHDGDSDSTVSYDNNYNASSKMGSHNILQDLISSVEKSAFESFCKKVQKNIQKDEIGREFCEENRSQNVACSADLLRNSTTSLNNDKLPEDEMNKGRIELSKTIDMIQEVSNISNVSSNMETIRNTPILLHQNKVKERVDKTCLKPSNNQSNADTFHTKESVAVIPQKKLSYRKLCESTIKDMVVVKPPPIENEIAMKQKIREVVAASGLVTPMKIDGYGTKGRGCPQMMVKNNVKPKNALSEAKSESFPFCRQGMSGRRKTVIDSASNVPEELKNVESIENQNYCETFKKQQRVAHVPKPIATPCKRNLEESSCDEFSGFYESPERQCSTKHKLSQKPPVKRTKLQKLKQQCINQRKRIQGLVLHTSEMKPSAKVVAKELIEEKSTQEINGCIKNLPTVDIALDMALSDSDESCNGKNSNNEKYKSKPVAKRESKKIKLSESLCSSKKQAPSNQEGEGKNSHERLDQLKYHSQENRKSKEICTKLLTNLENLSVDADIEETLCGVPISKHAYEDSSEKTRCGNSDQNCNEAVTTSSKDVSQKQMVRNPTILTVSQHLSQNATKSNDSNSVNFQDTNEALKPINCLDDIMKGSKSSSESKEIVGRDVSDSLMSPLSPPDLSNYETNVDHLPKIIPTSPQPVSPIKNYGEEIITEQSETNIDEDTLRNQDLEFEGWETDDDYEDTEEDYIDDNDNNIDCEFECNRSNDQRPLKSNKLVNLETLVNMKAKLRSWNKKVKPGIENCKGSNILKEYFEHHHKEEEVKMKAEKKNKKPLALKQHAEKKKKLEILFDAYLSEEFTETSLASFIKNCKNLIGGDYGIIVKFIVKHCKYSSNEEYDFSKNFPMNPTQQRLFTFVIKLENEHPTIVNEVMERIEHVVCSIKHHRFLETLNCLARFFTAFCKLHNDKHRAQIFCFDALFCLKFRAHTVLFAVFTTFPECFPKADTLAGDSPVVKAMVHVIFSYGNATYTATKNLRTYMSGYYCYKRDDLVDAVLWKNLMDKINCGNVSEVELAILLLAKFKTDWTWKYEKLIKGCLLPIIDNRQKDEASGTAAASCIKLCALLAKIPPYEKKDTSSLMKFFAKLLFLNTSTSKIKEACIYSLIALVNFNVKEVIGILKKCESEKYLQNSELKNILSVVMKKRNFKWWKKFL